MKKLLLLVLLLAAIPASAFDLVVNQTAYADDGLVHVESTSGGSEYFSLNFEGSGYYGNTLGAYGADSVSVSGSAWIGVSGNVQAYVIIGSVRWYGSAPTTSTGFIALAGYRTGVALTVPSSSTATITIVAYKNPFVYDYLTFTLGGDCYTSRFLDEMLWMSDGSAWNSNLYITIYSTAPIGYLVAYCDGGGCAP